MNFKQAVEEMKKGKKVRRKGWKDVWLTLDNGGSVLRTIPNMYKGTIKGTITGFELLTLENAENVCADDWEVLEKKKEKTWWKPKIGENYWSIRPWSGAVIVCYNDHKIDGFAVSMGLCFQTEEQAKFMVEKLKVIHKLEKFAYENNEEEIDWNNEDQRKFFLYYSYSANQVLVNYVISMKEIPFNVYFTSDELAEKAIETIGEDRIKKYYFGVDEDE